MQKLSKKVICNSVFSLYNVQTYKVQTVVILYVCTFYIPFLSKTQKPRVQVVCLYVTEAELENTNYFLESQA